MRLKHGVGRTSSGTDMKRQFQTARRAGLMAGVAALALSGAAHAADATTTAPADGVTGLEEVVVTAQKRKTNLQDTPIAISAMDSEALKAGGFYFEVRFVRVFMDLRP
ncbi:hypothetical protein, partial [Caulobacter sp. CCH5-E12]|uniref:hypothetical protein n=1 Tax=Caulobacter sp. CCH5-E12 TaxID=1768770 RepID=UPI001E41D36A